LRALGGDRTPERTDNKRVEVQHQDSRAIYQSIQADTRYHRS